MVVCQSGWSSARRNASNYLVCVTIDNGHIIRSVIGAVKSVISRVPDQSDSAAIRSDINCCFQPLTENNIEPEENEKKLVRSHNWLLNITHFNRVVNLIQRCLKIIVDSFNNYSIILQRQMQDRKFPGLLILFILSFIIFKLKFNILGGKQ